MTCLITITFILLRCCVAWSCYFQNTTVRCFTFATYISWRMLVVDEPDFPCCTLFMNSSYRTWSHLYRNRRGHWLSNKACASGLVMVLFACGFSPNSDPYCLNFSSSLRTTIFASKNLSTHCLMHGSSYLSSLPFLTLPPGMHLRKQVSVRECIAGCSVSVVFTKLKTLHRLT